MPVIATPADGADMDLYNMAHVSRAFAVVGGLLFAGSLVFFAVSYAWRFDEVIGPVVYLASDAASFITGEDHCVSGGMLR